MDLSELKDPSPPPSPTKAQSSHVHPSGYKAELRKLCEKAWFPISTIGVGIVMPAVLEVSADSCACVALFLSVSLVIAMFINEDALHAMFYGDAAFSLFIRVINWIVGQGALWALIVLVENATINSDEFAIQTRPTLTAIVFLTISYLNLMFCVSCAHFQGKAAVYMGAAGPSVMYATFVGYVIFKVNAEMLPLILTPMP
jgi:hypothetical protein